MELDRCPECGVMFGLGHYKSCRYNNPERYNFPGTENAGSCPHCGNINGTEHKEQCPEYLAFKTPVPTPTPTPTPTLDTVPYDFPKKHNSATEKREEPFSEIFKRRVSECRNVLQSKSTEYSKNNNRYHNFDVAARLLNTTPEKALEGMMIKHFVSIQDIINNAENITTLPPRVLSEKITDTINYLILLEGLLRRRFRE